MVGQLKVGETISRAGDGDRDWDRAAGGPVTTMRGGQGRSDDPGVVLELGRHDLDA